MSSHYISWKLFWQSGPLLQNCYANFYEVFISIILIDLNYQAIIIIIMVLTIKPLYKLEAFLAKWALVVKFCVNFIVIMNAVSTSFWNVESLHKFSF